MRRMRFFKQLEFLFLGGTQGPARLAHLRGRDHALESQARDLLRALGAEELARKIRVEWNPRLKTCAGRADDREQLISLNPLLCELENELTRNKSKVAQRFDGLKPSSLTSVAERKSENVDRFKRSTPLASVNAAIYKEVDRTLRHELAHLLAQWRARRRRIAPHGSEWRRACRDLGIPDEARCHDLPFATKVYQARYLYRCPNCKAEFPRVRRIRRAIACLACCRKYNGDNFDPRFRLKLKINHE